LTAVDSSAAGTVDSKAFRSTLDTQYRMKRLLAFFSILLLSYYAAAIEYRGPEGLSFDLPEGWSAFGEPKLESFSFTNSDRTAFLQVFRFQPDMSISIEQLFGYVKSGISGEGDHVPYLISGMDAIFASLSFTAAGNPVAGYAICVRTGDADIAAIAYATTDADLKDILLSALDSIAFTDTELTRPGPVSQFMLAPESIDATAVIKFSEFYATFPIDTGEFEVAQLVIEREARLLAKSSGEDPDTWKRYYRVIYRDNYERLARLGEGFASYATNYENRIVAEQLLAWLQTWKYERTGTLSDLLNPYESTLREIGDCDARALVYATLLHYAGIEASLLVSSLYQHALCAVGVTGEGAVMQTDKGPQIVAETTESVDLGLIASEQADPAGWTVVDLDGNRGPR
jgi:hypothetical protein